MIEASFYRKEDDGNATCLLCAHRCRIMPGGFGSCGVRKNVHGTLMALTYGHLIASNVDPVEKKPLYHFLPGSTTFSIAAPGCNFRCGFCQNWEISQLRKSNAERFTVGSGRTTPEAVVAEALENGCKSIAFTYTEPTVFFEFMKNTSSIAKESGLKTVMVSNGFMSEKTTAECCTFIDAFNIDLKSFSETFYREKCGGSLNPVLENISSIINNGNLLELTTLLIPGENDSSGEVGAAADFIAALKPSIPWHLSRFFPRYQFVDRRPTPELSIENARNIAHGSGLKFIYCGNVAGPSNTNCPQCGNTLITRKGYTIQSAGLKNGMCTLCSRRVEGIWQ